MILKWLEANIWRAAALALAIYAATLLVQIHGLPPLGGGLIARLDRMTELRTAEANSHRRTKANFRAGMAEARRRELARLAMVKAQQERINADVQDDHSRRVAALYARYHGLLKQARTRAESAAAGQSVPGLPAAPGGPDAQTGPNGLPLTELTLAERLEASLIATQLDGLIRWVERQARVDPND
jgi:hypothetical protein